MDVFYFNLPWVINQSEYNCSGRSLAEWKSRGSVNKLQGIYYAVSGAFFVALYAACLIGMYRGKLLKTPCYCLMFFNGFFDITDLTCGSLFSAYFHLTGAVFCSSIALTWFTGYLSWCIWCGASFNCAVLALNRVVEMVPSAEFLRFLFRGKSLGIWMVMSTAYTAVMPFITRTHPFNSAISTYLPSPMITDDATKEAAHFATLLVTIHNGTTVSVLIGLYSILCFYVIKMRRFFTGSHYKAQVQLLVQVTLICSTIAITASLYVLSGFFSVSQGLIIANNILWQLSHGLHGIIYFCFNRSIRTEVLRMCGGKGTQPVTVIISAIDEPRIWNKQ